MTSFDYQENELSKLSKESLKINSNGKKSLYQSSQTQAF